jgi:hypothetical protein
VAITSGRPLRPESRCLPGVVGPVCNI